MIKTYCDVCGKDMSSEMGKASDAQITELNFCISSYGRIWDICNDCRGSLLKWIDTQEKEFAKKSTALMK